MVNKRAIPGFSARARSFWWHRISAANDEEDGVKKESATDWLL
jgi:hypothetical protein